MASQGGDEKIVIYIDVYFCVNFLMDLMVLFLMQRICRFAATFPRMLLSATFGALWAIIVLIAPENIKIGMNICTYTIVSFMMVRICAGKKVLQDIAKGVAVLLIVTFALAGALHLLIYNTYVGFWIKGMPISTGKMILFVTISVVIGGVLYMPIARMRAYQRNQYEVTLELCGNDYHIKGLLDTGNVLVDPFFQQPVCILQKSVLANILNEIETNTKARYHLIPYRSLGCQSGMLPVIQVPIMYIYSGKKSWKEENVWVGVSDMELSADGAFQMLLHASFASKL